MHISHDFLNLCGVKVTQTEAFFSSLDRIFFFFFCSGGNGETLKCVLLDNLFWTINSLSVNILTLFCLFIAGLD